jgi:zinc transporter ZupT
MLTTFQWIGLLSILAATFAGGFLPLMRRSKAGVRRGMALGEAFTAGVFLALALTLMLPSASHLLDKAFPGVDYPIASGVAIGAFLLLLGIGHMSQHIQEARGDPEGAESALSPPVIPLIMTAMIAVPSFFLGAAFGVSPTDTAILIFVAIMIHKSSAAFALALKMVRSTLTRPQVWLTFCLFAFSTPLGILVGADVHRFLGSEAMTVVKGIILALAAGTFLFMATLHEFRHAPMIIGVRERTGFAVMLAGLIVTAFVKFLIGEAHRLG